MTPRQKILKLIYPLIIWRSKWKDTHNKIFRNQKNIAPATSIFDLSVQLNNGKVETLSAYRNKKILLINTASDCGYTNQYEALETLYEKNSDKLTIIGFPSNDFKEQEKGSDEEIAQFCKINFGVSFPLAKKSTVLKGNDQNEIFQWLSDKNKNGWLDKEPPWNFSKYLINEEGLLTHYFEPAVSPLSKEVVQALKTKL
ncbi:MAG: glutathione peroxidase [Parafilimonas sp.]